MMIVPQLITSVTTLYYTASANLAKFVHGPTMWSSLSRTPRSWIC